MKLTLKGEFLKMIEKLTGETCDEIRKKPLIPDDNVKESEFNKYKNI